MQPKVLQTRSVADDLIHVGAKKLGSNPTSSRCHTRGRAAVMLRQSIGYEYSSIDKTDYARIDPIQHSIKHVKHLSIPVSELMTTSSLDPTA